MLNIDTKKSCFVEYASSAFANKDLNMARQAAEAFCKIAILKKLGETVGVGIISDSSYSLNLAIENKLFKPQSGKTAPILHKKVKSYLLVLQNHGNLDSHDDDFSKLDLNEVDFCLVHLAKLTKFLYKELLEETIPSDLNSYLMSHEKQVIDEISSVNGDWLKINEITNNFSESQQRFILITDKCGNNPILSNLSNIKWSYIGDFDKDSHSNGLYSILKDELEDKTDVSILTLNNQLCYSKSTLFIDFLNGYSPDGNTIVEYYRQWQQKYITSNKIHKHLENLFNGGIASSDIYILINWQDNNTLKYLFDFINVIDSVFSDTAHLLFLSSNGEVLESEKKEIEQYGNIKKYDFFNISIENFAALLRHGKETSSDAIVLPALQHSTNIATTIEIAQKEFIPYRDDIKIYPYRYDADSVECSDFYRGKSINFNFLHFECDINRVQTAKICDMVSSRLNGRNSQLMYLLSEAGSGSTTIASRVLWQFRQQFPSFELLNYRKERTFEFFQKAYTETNKPLLIFADHNINEEDIKNLTYELNLKRISNVILYIHRFVDKDEPTVYSKGLERASKISFIISESLERAENENFYRKLSQKYSNEQDALLDIKNDAKCTLFKYNFTIFLERYENIDTYVADRLNALNEFEKKRTKILALVQYYTGISMPIKFLTKSIRRDSLYKKNHSINSLLVYNDTNDELQVKFIHNAICVKILENLTGVADRRVWKQKLGDIAIEFLSFLQEEHPAEKQNVFVKDIVNKLFIKRHIATYDSDNRNGFKYYTDLINDINTTNSPTDIRESIFKKLVEVYPDDSHYIAHLGRFYSVDRKNIDNALECINRAISISEANGIFDSILYHMKGMAYFREIKRISQETEDINAAIAYGKLASDCFILSREYDQQINNEYPFVSHAQMLLTILELGKRKSANNSVYDFINNSGDSFVTNMIDNIENLISDFDVIRTGGDDFNEMQGIHSRLLELQGDIGKSLEILNNLLAKNSYDNGALRRNIVRLNIEKHKGNINDIGLQRVTTLIEHLSGNLDNFSLHEANSADLLLWLRLIRHDKISIDLLDIASRLSYIKSILGEEKTLKKPQYNMYVVVLFYLYIIRFIQFIYGDEHIIDELLRLKKELKNKAMHLDGNSIAREWLGIGSDKKLNKVINWHDQRLKWIKEDKFFDSDSEKNLFRCTGIIKEIQNQKVGTISYRGLKIHFIPKIEFTASHINKEVSFYLSFSYDETSAWKVELI